MGSCDVVEVLGRPTPLPLNEGPLLIVCLLRTNIPVVLLSHKQYVPIASILFYIYISPDMVVKIVNAQPS